MTATSKPPADRVYRHSHGGTITFKQEYPMTRAAPPTADLDRLTERLVRAAEHVVAGVGDTPASPAGIFALPEAVPPGLVEAVTAAATARLAAFLGRLPLLSQTGSTGWPKLPLLKPATAAAQGGQKLEAHSQAWSITTDPAAVTVDASAMVNVSVQLDSFGPVVDQLLRIAVVAEAERQVLDTIEAVGTGTAHADLAAALAHFDGSGLWAPALVVTPPGSLLTLGPDLLALQAGGIEVVVVNGATAVTVLDPLAVTGAITPVTNLVAAEPSMLGRATAWGIYGRVSANADGVATVA